MLNQDRLLGHLYQFGSLRAPSSQKSDWYYSLILEKIMREEVCPKSPSKFELIMDIDVSFNI